MGIQINGNLEEIRDTKAPKWDPIFAGMYCTHSVDCRHCVHIFYETQFTIVRGPDKCVPVHIGVVFRYDIDHSAWFIFISSHVVYAFSEIF